jgi:hypothetical protein
MHQIMHRMMHRMMGLFRQDDCKLVLEVAYKLTCLEDQNFKRTLSYAFTKKVTLYRMMGQMMTAGRRTSANLHSTGG